MKIGIVGSGVVGKTLAGGYAAHGHEVVLGTRDQKREDIVAWLAQASGPVRAGTVLEDAAFGEIAATTASASSWPARCQPPTW